MIGSVRGFEGAGSALTPFAFENVDAEGMDEDVRDGCVVDELCVLRVLKVLKVLRELRGV